MTSNVSSGTLNLAIQCNAMQYEHLAVLQGGMAINSHHYSQSVVAIQPATSTVDRGNYCPALRFLVKRDAVASCFCCKTPSVIAIQLSRSYHVSGHITYHASSAVINISNSVPCQLQLFLAALTIRNAFGQSLRIYIITSSSAIAERARYRVG